MKKKLLVTMAGLLVFCITAALFIAANIGPMHICTNTSKAKSDVSNFKVPLDCYKYDVGTYPVSLDLLINDDKPGWDGPYLSSPPPADPWGRPYKCMAPGKHNPNSYDVWSLGPDGIDGTADDIGNWK